MTLASCSTGGAFKHGKAQYILHRMLQTIPFNPINTSWRTCPLSFEEVKIAKWINQHLESKIKFYGNYWLQCWMERLALKVQDCSMSTSMSLNVKGGRHILPYLFHIPQNIISSAIGSNVGSYAHRRVSIRHKTKLKKLSIIFSWYRVIIHHRILLPWKMET